MYSGCGVAKRHGRLLYLLCIYDCATPQMHPRRAQDTFKTCLRYNQYKFRAFVNFVLYVPVMSNSVCSSSAKDCDI